MKRIADKLRSAAPATDVQFRKRPYGRKDVRQFLQDVLAMANAEVAGDRYIFVGVGLDGRGRKRFSPVHDDDFEGKPAYEELVSEFIEPHVRLSYKPMSVDGKRIGAYEIGDCQDRPYMMRIDHSEKLRRGDAYMRIDDASIKLGRRHLQEMFEARFRDSVFAESIEIGFPGEIMHKKLRVPTTDLTDLPSAIGGRKLKQMLDIYASAKGSGWTTMMARLTHARLFGSDAVYENRSRDELKQEMADIGKNHVDDDEYFLFEEHGERLQLVVHNQGSDPIENASLSLIMPAHASFHVAQQLPKLRKDGDYMDRRLSERERYPSVSVRDEAIHVSQSIGDIPADTPVDAFDMPLRICAGAELRGCRFGIRYSLFGRNLRSPARGKLRLVF